jgi:hypothetical protein
MQYFIAEIKYISTIDHEFVLAAVLNSLEKKLYI